MFSIIIPSFNYAHYLPRAIDSVLRQSGDGVEIIVIDDGSTDHTAIVGREYESHSGGKIRYIKQENQGPAAARNHGVRLASGQYIVFLDADDELLPDALQAFRGGFHRGISIDFVWGASLGWNARGVIKHRSPSNLSHDRAANFHGLLRAIYGMNIGAVAMRKRVFERIRFPECNRGFEHVVFYAHLLALHDGVSIPDCVVRIYPHAGSLGHDIEWFKLRRLATVDLVFDRSILPQQLMGFRNEYLCGIWTSLFRDMQAALQASDTPSVRKHLETFPRIAALSAEPGCAIPKADKETSRACLSLFRTLYRRGYHDEAWQFYRLALRCFPAQALRWCYVRKCGRLALRRAIGNPFRVLAW